MYWNLQVTDVSLQPMGLRCAKLVDLNVSGCKRLTDVGMRHLAAGVPRFTHLNLTRCVRAASPTVCTVTSPDLASARFTRTSRRVTVASWLHLRLTGSTKRSVLSGAVSTGSARGLADVPR